VQTLGSADDQVPGPSGARSFGPSDIQVSSTSDTQPAGSSNAKVSTLSDPQPTGTSNAKVSALPDPQPPESFNTEAPKHVAAAPVSNSISLMPDLDESIKIPKRRRRGKFRNSIGSISSLFHREKNGHRGKDTKFAAKQSDQNILDIQNKKAHVPPIVRPSTNMKQS
jgi:hypothetical protein